MLACIFMHEMTGEARWRSLFATQAERLLGELVETDCGPLWTQDLYGSHERYLGPVHGFAGNMIPLLRGWAWLDEGQQARVTDTVPRTPLPTRSVGPGRFNGDRCRNKRAFALPALPWCTGADNPPTRRLYARTRGVCWPAAS
jgi:hypothetical protein